MVLPRRVPGDFASLPAERRELAARLPAVAGRLSSEARVLRAARAGATDRAVANRDQRFPDAVEPLTGLSPRIFVILVAVDGTGPWVARSRGEHVAACGSPLVEGTVSRGFPSESEARAYFWGTGLAAVLPAPWRRQ